MDATDMTILECGYYLLIGGGIAAACGLLLLLRLGNVPSLSVILGVGAIAGGALVIARRSPVVRETQRPRSMRSTPMDMRRRPSLASACGFGIGAGVVAPWAA